MNSPSSSPTTCIKQLGQVDFVDIFQDWETLLIALFAPVVMAFPAVSVYFRNTEERPMRSYFYSCLVKAIVSFLTVSVIVGDIFQFVKSDCASIKRPTVPFMAAALTELAELVFDYGRLVLFFSDPGKIDFYQNIRWNSMWSSGSGLRGFAICLASLPIVLLLAVMWIFVFISNFDPKKIFFDPQKTYYSSDMDDSSDRGFYVATFAIFGTLALSIMGAYYLLRMCCPFASNNGEERGLGFFWSRFKLVAVDLPSLLSSLFVRPSSLILFWTAEFINDVFPYVASLAAEKYFLEGERHRGANQDSNENNDILIDSEIDLSRSDVVMIYFERIVETYYHSTIHYTDNDMSSRARLARSMGNKPARKVVKYKVDRAQAERLTGEITETEWSNFCDNVDIALEPMSVLKSKNYGLIFLKSFFLLLGAIGSLVYWGVAFTLKFGEEVPSATPLYALVVLVPVIFFCVKGCFRRNLSAEFDIIEGLHKLLIAENAERSNVKFVLCMEDDIMKALKIWCCRGGLSCAKSVESISYIECHIIHNSCASVIEEGKGTSIDSPTIVAVKNKDVDAKCKISSYNAQEGSVTATTSSADISTKESEPEHTNKKHNNGCPRVALHEIDNVSTASEVQTNVDIVGGKSEDSDIETKLAAEHEIIKCNKKNDNLFDHIEEVSQKQDTKSAEINEPIKIVSHENTSHKPALFKKNNQTATSP